MSYTWKTVSIALCGLAALLGGIYALLTAGGYVLGWLFAAAMVPVYSWVCGGKADYFAAMFSKPVSSTDYYVFLKNGNCHLLDVPARPVSKLVVHRRVVSWHAPLFQRRPRWESLLHDGQNICQPRCRRTKYWGARPNAGLRQCAFPWLIWRPVPSGSVAGRPSDKKMGRGRIRLAEAKVDVHLIC
jgi:hypothetical protein